MIYKKPENLKYTDMAIYIDSHIYCADCNDELIYEYLYHICFMLANQNKFFNCIKDYEDFSLFVASSVFSRLKNKKQFELDSNNNYKLPKIKSVLNYIKNVIFFRKLEFDKLFALDTNNSDDIEIVPAYTFADKLSRNAFEYNKIDFECCLDSIINTIRVFMKKLPYKYKSKEWYDIYLSCLLSILNYITLSNKDIQKISNMVYKVKNDDFINSLYDNYKNEVILFCVDPILSDYIKIIVKQLMKIISEDFKDIHEYNASFIDIKNAVIFNDINNLKQVDI